MPSFLILEFTALVLTHVLATFIGARYGRWLWTIFFQYLSSRPKINSLKREILTQGDESSRYQRYPRKWWFWPDYYLREHEEHLTPPGRPTYDFFTRDGINVEEFMAFLIPSLEFGHGRRNPLRLEAWEDYLLEIVERIRATKRDYSERKLSRIKRSRLKEAEGVPQWSRVVFFDQYLLAIMLFNYSWVKNCLASNSQVEEPLRKLAARVKNYAFDVVIITQRMQDYRDAIECRFVAESAVPAGECYDFGLYRIEGVQVVYMPMHLNNEDMEIKREKVLLGTTNRQRRGIGEHVRTYCRLWKAAERPCHKNASKLNEIPRDSLNDPNCEAFQFDYLTLESFSLIYGAPLATVLTREFGSTFPAARKLPSSNQQET